MTKTGEPRRRGRIVGGAHRQRPPEPWHAGRRGAHGRARKAAMGAKPHRQSRHRGAAPSVPPQGRGADVGQSALRSKYMTTNRGNQRRYEYLNNTQPDAHTKQREMDTTSTKTCSSSPSPLFAPSSPRDDKLVVRWTTIEDRPGGRVHPPGGRFRRKSRAMSPVA